MGKKAANACALTLFVGMTSALFAQKVPDALGQPNTGSLSLGQVFTFLLLTLGPFNVLRPFAAMTRGRDAAFTRKLAFDAIVIALSALLVAATLGARSLKIWGISVGALFITSGIVLFLVALQPVLEQYKPRESRAGARADTTTALPVSALAFSPLAFPTIVTPYGIAVLILLLTLRPGTAGAVQVLGVTALVLVLDLLAMLGADRILKSPLLMTALGIVGSVMGVLQIAVGVQAVVRGIRLLGF